MPHRHRLRLTCPEPFDLQLLARSHGWYDLEPFSWDAEGRRLSYALATGRGAADVVITEGRGGLTVSVSSARALTRAQLEQLRVRLRRVLRLDDDLTTFWERCREHPRLEWVAERGAGRLLRGATLFEDLVKLLFTTNCSWSATRSMTRNLVAAFGRPSPSGRHAFPSAADCRPADETFLREHVRCGYRASSLLGLRDAFVERRLRDDSFDPARRLSTDALREHLLALPGFGPYAAGQAMRLLGRYDDLALDSWCRGKLARMEGRRRPPSDAAIARRYRDFGPFAGLALWMDLTADWHDGEAMPL